MKEPIARQQLKILPLQFGGALVSVGLYMLYDFNAFFPLFYSVGIGLCYSIMLYLGVSTANRLSKDSPQQGMAMLAVFAVVRFIVTGVLIVIGFKYWSTMPVALMLPFVVVLLAPMLLVPMKKRLTD